MEGMKSSLSCPICFELFEQAKTLPCQHVVCAKCIALWAARKGQLTCPSCLEEHEVPAGGVSNLPTNVVINGMVESFKEGLELEDDGSPDLNGSFIELSGKSHEHVCDAIITFSIKICDSKGKPIRGFDSKRLNATIIYEKNKLDLVPKKANEKFEVRFIPNKCGVYVVEAFLDGQGITKSPLELVVHPKGHILSVIRGCMKQPKDVISDGDSIFVTDSSNGNYLHLDWLGYDKSPVSDNVKVGRAGKDLSPCGIFRAAAGNTVYVTDTDSNSVRIYDDDRYVCSFGDGNLDQPLGIAVDRNKFIYVANKLSNAISVFDEFHMSLRTIRVEGGGKKPTVAPSLACIALNSAEDKLIVADQANCCLKIINLAQSKVEHSITTKVFKHTVRPFGVAVDSDDNIYASVCFTEFFNNFMGGASRVSGARERTKGAVLMYNSSGYFLGRFGESELINPGGIFVLEKANHISILVVETGGNGYGSRAPGLRIFCVA